MKENRRSFVYLTLGPLIGLNILAWLIVSEMAKPKILEVSFFDVGQGDAIFIVTPQDHQILIDGGPDFSVLEKLGQEMAFYDRSIDLMVLSHPEHDHIAGLIEVLKRYKVANILWTGVLRDTAEFQEWEGVIEKERETEKAKIYITKASQKITCAGSLPAQRVIVEILFPFENLEGRIIKNSNNTSIVTKLVFNNNTFLFTGDAYISVEKKLLENDIILDSDVLKVGHHGSKTSSSEEFLKEVSPEIAIISAGKDNSYGHPHPEILARLNKYDINVLRTDLIGDIKIISDGLNLKTINLNPQQDEKDSRPER